jgi:hypothetical protein
MKLIPNNPDKYESATDSELEDDPEPDIPYYDTEEQLEESK